jgi:hypothetical protein
MFRERWADFRFKALQLSLSSSYHLMRILCPIVLPQPLFVTARQL